MSRVYNFSAGRLYCPESVLKSAAEEMLDYKGCGMSVMEMSHRSKAFEEIIKTAEVGLRELMHIRITIKCLFLQGGALTAVCDDSDELDEKQGGGLHCDWTMGKKSNTRKQQNMVRSIKLLLQKIKHFLTYQIVQIFQSQKMQTMCIFVKIIRFMEPNLRNCQIQKERHL